MKAVIDWLQGRVQGFDGNGQPLVADWDNGKAGMIGKSYDGTFANGVASTGVAGLTTIVPISAISAWYDYSRSNGVRHNVTHYPEFLSRAITVNRPASNLGVVPPSRTDLCAQTRTDMSAVDGDATGDVNPFWAERGYNADVANVHASVLAVHGLNDDNVMPDHLSKWWAGLAANGVPRKLWLSQEGHIDPFDFRRATWVDTLHRWFDYWLQDVSNGIMSEPRVMIERSTDVFEDRADWPLPGTAGVDFFLQGTAAGAAGTFGLTSGGDTDDLTFTDLPSQNENAMIGNPTGSQTNRLVFLSKVLTDDLHLSGTPVVDIEASFNKTTGNLGAILVDYAPFTFTRPTRAGDGVRDTTTQTCWGESTPTDSACYVEVTKPTVNVTSWRVSKGILAAENRDSFVTPTNLVAGQPFGFTFPTLPVDYVFPVGHQVGVVLVSNYAGYGAATNTTAPTAQVTLDTRLSKVVLPVVGGSAAALASGAFTVDTTPPQLQLPVSITRPAAGATTAVTYAVSAVDDTDANPAVACTPPSGSAFPLGTTTVHCTATDDSGNVASGSFDVTVADTDAPSLQLPSQIFEQATSPAGPAVTYSATAEDAVDTQPTVSCDPASGSRFPVGTTTVACSARDASGNVTRGAFVVTVTDQGAPVLQLPESVRGRATSRAGGTVGYAVTATDLVDSRPRVSCLPASGSVFPLGTTRVRCTATDAGGNVVNGSFEVTVADLTTPVLVLPAPLRLDATSRAGAIVRYGASARDAVDSRPRVSCLPASGSRFAIGTTVVRCTATDAEGNSTRRSFAVHVRGAAAQLSDLRRDVAGAGRGQRLANRVAAIQTNVAAGHRPRACIALGAFRAEVTAQSGRTLSRAKANALLADAARISTVLGC
jgi:X-Pro dipeptidyl-peptidase